MALTAKAITKIIIETNKARDTADKLRDFADLMTKQSKDIKGEVKPQCKRISDGMEVVQGEINAIRETLQTQLDEIPVDEKEVKDAAEKLLLYQNKPEHALLYAQQQLGNHKENSHWWLYWNGIINAVIEKTGIEPVKIGK
ncbi:MAG: hypothetical protein OXF42_06385 [Candidatus Dadabacteria bacterium]|nr:hypothetical protein [Candidatus Dadabacteria bacterium]MCY4043026.1 hypothetical protein [Candidatus Dadabacteria bacterium]MCY4047710.1 hypothetical protein [Candidatus Dadabacteria bacterium]